MGRNVQHPSTSPCVGLSLRLHPVLLSTHHCSRHLSVPLSAHCRVRLFVCAHIVRVHLFFCLFVRTLSASVSLFVCSYVVSVHVYIFLSVLTSSLFIPLSLRLCARCLRSYLLVSPRIVRIHLFVHLFSSAQNLEVLRVLSLKPGYVRI